MKSNTQTFFAPQLFIPRGTKSIGFYIKAFDAVEKMRFTNDDGSIHVAELSINDSIFHLHESTPDKKLFSPAELSGSTVIIGLYVSDVNALMQKAVDAGAKLVSPVTDYEYGLRQGIVEDPFGHQWLIQKVMETV